MLRVSATAKCLCHVGRWATSSGMHISKRFKLLASQREVYAVCFFLFGLNLIPLFGIHEEVVACDAGAKTFSSVTAYCLEASRLFASFACCSRSHNSWLARSVVLTVFGQVSSCCSRLASLVSWTELRITTAHGSTVVHCVCLAGLTCHIDVAGRCWRFINSKHTSSQTQSQCNIVSINHCGSPLPHGGPLV